MLLRDLRKNYETGRRPATKPGALPRWPGLTVALPLLALVLTINGVAIWGIVSTEGHAREAARRELELRTVANARSFEALLATLRGDFIFLARSPPMARFLATREDPNPMVRRFSRLDVEATLLLFLEANPSVERLLLTTESGDTLLAAGRRLGTPELLSAGAARPAPSAGWLHGAWDLAGDGGGRLEAWLEPRALLRIAAPADDERLRLELGAAPRAADVASDGTARVAVSDESWTPPLRGSLARGEPESLILRSVESLAGRLRVNVALNLLVISLSLVLGSLALRQARRAALLAAEKEQQARVGELERQLIHSERLASVGRLAAGIAHEINNPLAGMSHHLLLLEEDLAAGDDEAAAACVPRVREGLERTAGVVRQVLRFASPGESSSSEVDLAAVAAEAVAFLSANPAYREARVDLLVPKREESERGRTRCDSPAGDWRVRGNAVTLGQLLLNLLINACEEQTGEDSARSENGARPEVEVRLERDGGTARLTVADRGPGFAPEALEHLFEPFFSTRGSSGLGLAVCHGIARRHGGEIRVGERPGGGAVVEVRLPLLQGDD